MNTGWIALQSIPVTGKTLVFEDQSLWLEPLAEFGIPCRIEEPLRAQVEILPQEQGVLFRGRLSGKIALPCDRCADESMVTLGSSFDSFEPYPADSFAGKAGEEPRRAGGKASATKGSKQQEEALAPLDEDIDEAVIRNSPAGRGVEINPAALVWEEFSLALPVKPLCKDSCKGLCPECGVNRNLENCSCGEDKRDPRLAALHGLKVSPKK